MSCGHSPTFPSLHLRHNSFSSPSVASATSQLILQPSRCFTYVTAHSSTLLSLLLRHRLFTYVTRRAAHDWVNDCCSCLFRKGSWVFARKERASYRLRERGIRLQMADCIFLCPNAVERNFSDMLLWTNPLLILIYLLWSMGLLGESVLQILCFKGSQSSSSLQSVIGHTAYSLMQSC